AIAQTGSFVSPKRVEFDYFTNVPLVSTIRRFDAASGGTPTVTTSITLDPRELVATIEHTGSGGQMLDRYDYTYNANAQPMTTHDLYGDATFGYDAAGQLVVADYT